ncbi:MAG: hypothetical protein R6W96_01930 [Clostridia bacterium]
MSNLMQLMRTIDISGKVIIAIIIGVFVAALFINLFIKFKYMGISKQLASKQQRRTGVFKNDLLNKVVQEYKAAAANNYSAVNTQAIIDKIFMENLRFGLLGENFVKKSISMLIVLGLLGTFIGLTISVSELVNVLITDSTTSLDWVGILNSLSGAARGMGAAFITSLVGILMSIILNLILVVSNCEDERESLMVNIEEYLDNTIAVAISKDKETEYTMLNRILRETFIEFGNKIETSLKGTVEEFGEKLSHVVMDVSVSSKVLDSTVDRFEACLGTFAENIRDFTDFNQNLRNNIEMMDVSFIKMSESLKSSSSLIGDNFDAIKQFSTDVKDAANQMSSFNEGVVRDMETLIQQIDRSVFSINAMSEMLKESADTNSATMDSIQSSFLDSIGKINHQIIELTEKTQDSFNRTMTESSVLISSHLQQGIKSAIANLDAVVEKFDKNQRLLATTVASLPEQTMAFNKLATERVEAKLEEIKNTLSE